MVDFPAGYVSLQECIYHQAAVVTNTPVITFTMAKYLRFTPPTAEKSPWKSLLIEVGDWQLLQAANINSWNSKQLTVS